MSHTYIHAQNSARLFGGKPEDYLAAHDWMDSTKEMFCDFRHRALRHHSHGIFEGERALGHTIMNSEGKKVPVRYVLEQHVKEDCGGRVPSVSDWLLQIQPLSWMNRGYPIERAKDDEAVRVPRKHSKPSKSSKEATKAP